MNKLLTFIFAILFAMPCFATGVSGSAGTCDSGALGTDNGSTILRANYEPETIHLRWYDENNNLLTVNSASQSCTYGESITIPTAPTKTGYRFTGWHVFTDYTPIEYIESTGTQYIDTGIIATSGIKVETVVDRPISPETGTVWFPFGTKDDIENGQFSVFESTNSLGSKYVALKYGKTAYSIAEIFGRTSYNESKFILDYGILTFDNGSRQLTSQQSGQTFNTEHNIWLFKHEASVEYYANVKMYYIKIWDNGTLVRDMIPVKDLSGVACMYDKVSGQFFYNQGTGNFVAGPDL